MVLKVPCVNINIEEIIGIIDATNVIGLAARIQGDSFIIMEA